MMGGDGGDGVIQKGVEVPDEQKSRMLACSCPRCA